MNKYKSVVHNNRQNYNPSENNEQKQSSDKKKTPVIVGSINQFNIHSK